MSEDSKRAGAPVMITQAMTDCGAREILREVGGADLPAFFSAAELANAVYRAMANARRKGRVRL